MEEKNGVEGKPGGMEGEDGEGMGLDMNAQHQKLMFQQDLNQQAVIVMDGLFTSVDLTLSLLNNAETRL